ncbi:MAG: hypothetical protein D6732_28255 [Methanobacteriota archaeon]|nr:MAG: hypothetical protein D6732_28255 [Euryarchaeota archaeon]
MEKQTPSLPNRILIRGVGYDYLYSRGLIANHIKVRGIDYDTAYQIAKEVEEILLKKGMRSIDESDLFEMVRTKARDYLDPQQSRIFDIIERWSISGDPLIILLCGAPGSYTTEIGQILAEQFSISQIISTNTVRAILQRVIAPEIAPELHSESHTAYEHLRPVQTHHTDMVILGFEEHTKFVTETIESMINRALSENLSVLFRGVHLDPRFISRNILDKPNVFFFTIRVPNPKLQLNRLLEISGRGKEDEVTLDFPDIRKIHDYLVQETQRLKLPIANFNGDVRDCVNTILQEIIDGLDILYKSYEDKKKHGKDEHQS